MSDWPRDEHGTRLAYDQNSNDRFTAAGLLRARADEYEQDSARKRSLLLHHDEALAALAIARELRQVADELERDS